MSTPKTMPQATFRALLRYVKGSLSPQFVQDVL